MCPIHCVTYVSGLSFKELTQFLRRTLPYERLVGHEELRNKFHSLAAGRIFHWNQSYGYPSAPALARSSSPLPVLKLHFRIADKPGVDWGGRATAHID